MWTFGVVLAMPILIPVAILSQIAYRTRLRKAAKSFACINCGRTLGIEALKRADDVCSEQMRELTQANPGVRFRIQRTLHAICLTCGTRYTFREKERTFVVEQSRKSDFPA
jgi:hypothetical protein